MERLTRRDRGFFGPGVEFRQSMKELERRAAVAERAARAGAEVAADGFRAGLAVESKDGKTDYVTQADRDAQAAVVDALAEDAPGEPVVGEEAEALEEVPEEGRAWVVDPIDGTNNYVREIPVWATSVAAVEDGEPVAGATVMPALGDSYVVDGETVTRNGEPVAVSDHTDPETFAVVPTVWWDLDDRDAYARACEAIVDRFGDLRRWGCAQYTLAMLAGGAVEGVLTDRYTKSWDTMAGVAMVRAGGGTVTDLEGNRWRHDSEGLVASNGQRHDVLLATAREI
jgi:myo-inositol-1(or 4)-monophosphatase